MHVATSWAVTTFTVDNVCGIVATQHSEVPGQGMKVQTGQQNVGVTCLRTQNLLEGYELPAGYEVRTSPESAT